MPLVEFLFHCFPVENTENDCAKNWKGHAFSRLTEGDANNALPIWHSCIFISFLRISPARSKPARRNCAVTKGKRLEFFHHIGGADGHDKICHPVAWIRHTKIRSQEKRGNPWGSTSLDS